MSGLLATIKACWFWPGTTENVFKFQQYMSSGKGASTCQLRMSGACSFSVAAPKNLEFSPSISPYLYQSWYLPSSSQDQLLPPGLPVHLTPLFMRLRFGFCWPMCAFINYMYLLTYLLHPATILLSKLHWRVYSGDCLRFTQTKQILYRLLTPFESAKVTNARAKLHIMQGLS